MQDSKTQILQMMDTLPTNFLCIDCGQEHVVFGSRGQLLPLDKELSDLKSYFKDHQQVPMDDPLALQWSRSGNFLAEDFTPPDINHN